MTEKSMMVEAIKRIISNDEIDLDFNSEFYLRQLPDNIVGNNVWGLYIINKNTGRSYDFILHWDAMMETFL